MVRESTTQKFSHKGVNGANSHDGFCLPKSPNLRKTTLARAARDVVVLPPGSDRLRSRSKTRKISKRSILTNDSRRLRIKTLLLINLTSELVLLLTHGSVSHSRTPASRSSDGFMIPTTPCDCTDEPT